MSRGKTDKRGWRSVTKKIDRTMQPLREYQQTAVAEAMDALASARSALFVCPTGGGKTWVFAEIAARFRKHGRVLVLADREQLVTQAANVIAGRTDLRVGIEQGRHRVNRKTLPDVVCATIQSMSRRLADFRRDAFALVVIDEADLGVTDSYAAVLEHFAGAKVFGCTATPDRNDGQTLGRVFEQTITPLYLGDLITQGFLSPLRRTLVRIESVTLADLATRDGDFSATDLERILTHEKALHEVVRPSIDLAGSRPSIVFAATVKHAEALADVFNRYAPEAARVIHGGMKTTERASIIAAYNAGTVRFLCSCALLLRGVDLPQTSCVVMARPTQSRALYCQAIGRGTRLAPDKSDLLVLDFTDNSRLHSLVSPVDIIAPISDEVRERAREIADEQTACDPQEAIAQAERELEVDPELRERIQAIVTYRAEKLPEVDWDSLPYGTVSDSALAKQYGRYAAQIRYHRVQRGIPRFTPPLPEHAINWAQIPFDLMTNTDCLKMYNIKASEADRGRQSCGARPAWVDGDVRVARHGRQGWGDVPLGQYDDRLLAFLFRVRVDEIQTERERLGIKKYAVDFDTIGLGKSPDTVIAANYRLHRTTVTEAREARGIQPYRSHAGSSKGGR